LHIAVAIDPASRRSDTLKLLQRHRISFVPIDLSPGRVSLTGLHNQNPAMLLFHETMLVDRRLGAQSLEALREWVLSASRRHSRAGKGLAVGVLNSVLPKRPN
jgi:hypothetical protein